jgi:hypothetical protein
MTEANPVFAHHGDRLAFSGPTLDDVRAWPAAVDLPQACRALGISRAWGYELAASGEFPCRVLTVRGRRKVITASLIQVLSQTGAGPDAA